MRFRHLLLALPLGAAACADVVSPVGERSASQAAALLQTDAGIVASVTGGGHIDRSTPDDRALRNFTISAVQRADGSASGQFKLNIGPAADLLAGTVTCVAVRGNRAWVGGTIETHSFPFPVFAAVIELVDNGTTAGDPDNATDGLPAAGVRDQISPVGFYLEPGNQAAEWCANPVPGPVMDIDIGNITVR